MKFIAMRTKLIKVIYSVYRVNDGEGDTKKGRAVGYVGKNEVIG